MKFTNFPRNCLFFLEIFSDITNFSHNDCSSWSPLFICFGVNHLGGATDRGNEINRILEDSAPLKLPTRHCFPRFLPSRLENTSNKNGISLSTPSCPKTQLQSLPSTLRMSNVFSMSSCSKAPGVFSSNCR